VSGVVVGLFGDAFGRRRAPLILAGFMTLTGIAFAATDILTAVAFIGGLSTLAGSGRGGWAPVIDNRACRADYPVP
jgi:hypothetical protein